MHMRQDPWCLANTCLMACQGILKSVSGIVLDQVIHFDNLGIRAVKRVRHNVRCMQWFMFSFFSLSLYNLDEGASWMCSKMVDADIF